jgi:hypothetical protein
MKLMLIYLAIICKDTALSSNMKYVNSERGERGAGKYCTS